MSSFGSRLAMVFAFAPSRSHTVTRLADTLILRPTGNPSRVCQCSAIRFPSGLQHRSHTRPSTSFGSGTTVSFFDARSVTNATGAPGLSRSSGFFAHSSRLPSVEYAAAMASPSGSGFKVFNGVRFSACYPVWNLSVRVMSVFPSGEVLRTACSGGSFRGVFLPAATSNTHVS